MVCAAASACLAGGRLEDFARAYYDFWDKKAGFSNHFDEWAEKRDFVPAPRGSCDNGMRIFEPR